MTFLLQIYCPLDDECEFHFHRTLFVFICQNSSCSDVKVFRSQLARENLYYEYDPVALDTFMDDKLPNSIPFLIKV